jgi:hypothetical protein
MHSYFFVSLFGIRKDEIKKKEEEEVEEPKVIIKICLLKEIFSCPSSLKYFLTKY